ncbi:MAG: Rieske (2Fe-2S) protein [Chitinophagales bacterium]
MDRKEFIRLLGIGTLGVVALNQLGCSKADQQPRIDFYIDTTDPLYFSLLNTGGYVYVNGLIIFKGIDLNYYALSQYCTHQGCDVTYQVAFNELICPCHGSQYDINGQVTMGPAIAPLYQYVTEVVSGTLIHVFTP